jgi:hypothetical protein
VAWLFGLDRIQFPLGYRQCVAVAIEEGTFVEQLGRSIRSSALIGGGIGDGGVRDR